jgi:protein-disulfide isomerase
MREEAQRRARRRKWIVQGSVSAGVIVVLAIIALVVVTSIRPAGPGPQNMASGGILLTSTTKAVKAPPHAVDSLASNKESRTDNVAHIRVYLDYQCPYCKQFEDTNGKQIGKWVDSGIATVEIHPLSILDASSSGTHYSTRAANAAACMANDKPNRFYAVNSALFAKQPAEGGTGLTDEKILSIMKGAGASSDALTTCVKNGQFTSWVKGVTQKVTTAKKLPGAKVPLSGTPTVLVNGTAYSGSLTDASAFQSFVMQVMAAGSGAGSGSTSTSTPTPTPTPTAPSTPSTTPTPTP